MATDLHAIPKEVWRGFVEGGGLERAELLRYFKLLTTVRLEPATAQEDADDQRQRFKQLIGDLFPLERVEAFIAAHLEVSMFPRLQAHDLDAEQIPAMSAYLEQIVACGNRLTAVAEQARRC